MHPERSRRSTGSCSIFSIREERILGSHPGGGLLLEDSGTELRAEIDLPDSPDGQSTRALVDRGVIRGLSAEFYTRKQSWSPGRKRTVLEAKAHGRVDG